MKKRLGLLRKKLELTTTAITFAEAGEWDIAEDYVKKIAELNRDKTPKMLVVSMDSAFCPKIAEYSVNLAERMRFNLLALSVFNPEQKKSVIKTGENSELKRSASQVFGSLVDKARGRKIHLETLMAVHDFQSQIKRLLQQIHQIELVFVQVQKGKQVKLNVDVPVYQIETSEVC